MGSPRAEILVCGASIAGATLAYWLAKRGFAVTVVERAPSIREGGYSMTIRGAAMDVLRRMDAMSDVRARATGLRRIGIAHGRRMDKTAFIDVKVDPNQMLWVLRGDLCVILHRLTPNVEYVFDDSVSAVEPEGDRVRVAFKRGAPRTFDLVVGADGRGSSMRSLVFGPEARFTRDLSANVAFFTIDNYLALDREARQRILPGRGLIIYTGPTTENGKIVQRGKVLLSWRTAGAAHNPQDVAGQKEEIRKTYGADGWELPRLLERMEKATDFYFDGMTQIRMDTWTKGRVALVGDAAYCAAPISGEGACMALVGSYILAAEIAAADADPVRAFGNYERRLRPFIDAAQKLADAALDDNLPSSRIEAWAKVQLVRVLPLIQRIQGILPTGKAERAYDDLDAMPLPVYPEA